MRACLESVRPSPTATRPASRTRASLGSLSREGKRAVADPRARAYFLRMTVLDAEIVLTPSAAARVAAIAGRQGKPAILRLSVDGGGCSGFQYKFAFADAVEADDSVAERNGVRLVVDSISLDLVRGAAVDYVEELGGAAFRVTNPNAASGCGCGSSFAV